MATTAVLVGAVLSVIKSRKRTYSDMTGEGETVSPRRQEGFELDGLLQHNEQPRDTSLVDEDERGEVDDGVMVDTRKHWLYIVPVNFEDEILCFLVRITSGERKGTEEACFVAGEYDDWFVSSTYKFDERDRVALEKLGCEFQYMDNGMRYFNRVYPEDTRFGVWVNLTKRLHSFIPRRDDVKFVWGKLREDLDNNVYWLDTKDGSYIVLDLNALCVSEFCTARLNAEF